MWHVVHHTLGILVIVPRVPSPPSSTRRISMRRSWGRSTGRSMSKLASVGAASGTASSCRGRIPGFMRAAFTMLTRELSQKYTNSTTGATLTADDKYGASQASQHAGPAVRRPPVIKNAHGASFDTIIRFRQRDSVLPAPDTR